MEHPISNDENSNPKSLGRLGYNTAFKNNNIQFNKKLARTPLKSKINIMNSNQENLKSIKYPLLKQISTSNINQHKNKNKNISFDINNYNEEDEYIYNKNALPDDIEDFMHINENKITIENDIIDIDLNEINQYKKNDIKILQNIITPFSQYENNYVLGAHFEDDDDNDNNNNNNNNNEIQCFNTKKKFDDYFNESDDDGNDNDINLE